MINLYKKLYQEYFDKDKMLRHVAQHLFLALLALIVLGFFWGEKFDLNFSRVVIFLIATYAIDLDGVFITFIWQNQNQSAKTIVRYLKKFQFDKALSYATVHHKKLNKLMIHNFFSYPLLLIALVIVWQSQNSLGITILLAFLVHLTFDMFDDIYQLGHLKNWLWPFEFLSERFSVGL